MPSDSDSETDNEAALRLERALERIALAAAQSMAAQVRGEAEAVEIAEVKARLDALIVRLRAGLAQLG